jgi:hypothetical protein
MVRPDAVETSMLIAFDKKPTRLTTARAALVQRRVGEAAFEVAFRRLDALRLLCIEDQCALALPIEAEIIADRVRSRWTSHRPALRY